MVRDMWSAVVVGLGVHNGSGDAIAALFSIAEDADGLVVAQVWYAAHVALVIDCSTSATSRVATIVIAIATAMVPVSRRMLWSYAGRQTKDLKTRAHHRHEACAKAGRQYIDQ